MKIDRIAYTHTYQVGLAQWQKISFEASVDKLDSIQECLAKLEQESHNYHRASNPQLYKNGNEALVSDFTGRWYESWEQKDKPKVINRLYERMEIIINDCTTIEELAKHKDFANKNPDLMPAYMNKLKQLTEKIKA